MFYYLRVISTSEKCVNVNSFTLTNSKRCSFLPSGKMKTVNRSDVWIMCFFFTRRIKHFHIEVTPLHNTPWNRVHKKRSPTTSKMNAKRKLADSCNGWLLIKSVSIIFTYTAFSHSRWPRITKQGKIEGWYVKYLGALYLLCDCSLGCSKASEANRR